MKPAKTRPFGFWVAAVCAIAVVAIAGVYLSVVIDGSQSGPTFADASDRVLVADGKQVYATACASCHGVNLEGQPNWRSRLPDGRLPAPPHDETGHTWHHPDALLFAVTKFGGARNAPAGFVSGMPAFEKQLSDRQIWAALAYIKSRWPRQVAARQARIDRQSSDGKR
tara:strand:+ start:898 stop:1401 length:504 start_codon:yes stop_codon:yes gene_type:complete